MGILRRLRQSDENFNCYATIFLDASIVKSELPLQLYVCIVEDCGEYIEVDDVGVYHVDAEIMCPGCKEKRLIHSRKNTSRFISKNAIAMIKIEDKEG